MIRTSESNFTQTSFRPTTGSLPKPSRPCISECLVTLSVCHEDPRLNVISLCGSQHSIIKLAGDEQGTESALEQVHGTGRTAEQDEIYQPS